MKLIILAVTVILTGCATPPQWLANHFDRQDSCQSGLNRPELNRPEGYQVPAYCQVGNPKQIGVIRDMQGRKQAVITSR